MKRKRGTLSAGEEPQTTFLGNFFVGCHGDGY